MASPYTNPSLRSLNRWLTATLVAASLAVGGVGIHLAQNHQSTKGTATTATATNATASAFDDDTAIVNAATASMSGSSNTTRSFSTVTPVTSSTQPAATATTAS